MDEKKWFIYLGDHHEGPFSLNDIRQMIENGKATSDHYVWADGMQDWKLMTDVPDFETITGKKQSTTPPSELPVLESVAEPALVAEAVSAEAVAIEAEPVAENLNSVEPVMAEAVPLEAVEAEPVMAERVAEEPVAEAISTDEPAQEPEFKPAEMTPEEKTSDLDISDRDRIAKEATGMIEKPAEKKLKMNFKMSRGFLMILGLILILVGAGWSFMMGYLDPLLGKSGDQITAQTSTSGGADWKTSLVIKFPALGKFLPPFEQPAGVSQEDYDVMKMATLSPVSELGPRIEFVMSMDDPTKPVFYISHNLHPDTKFEFYIYGIYGTLVNQLNVALQGKISGSGYLRKSNPIALIDGRPLPKGEYLVTFVEEKQQNAEAQNLLMALPKKVTGKLPEYIPADRKVIISKTMFLGGKKDANYQVRVKEFNDKIKVRAQNELNELKQIALTQIRQFNDTVTQFSAIRKGAIVKGKLNPKSKKKWTDFSTQWMKMNDQLLQSYQQWSPEVLKKDYFYSNLYDLTKTAGMMLMKLHEMHHHFFQTAVDAQYDSQLAEAVSQAQTGLTTLRDKIQAVEKFPPGPNGIPKRDGL